MKIYKIKSLIEGYKVKPEYRDKILVCCRNDKGYTHIIYKNQIMKLPLALFTRSFPDKYGRGFYFLDYFEWQPVNNPWDLKDGEEHKLTKRLSLRTTNGTNRSDKPTYNHSARTCIINSPEAGA